MTDGWDVHCWNVPRVRGQDMGIILAIGDPVQMQMERIPVIIQAGGLPDTAGSLKNMLLQPLNDEHTALAYMTARIMQHWPGQVCLAITNEDSDELFDAAVRLGLPCFRSVYREQLRLLGDAAESLGCQRFIRVPASHPLVDMDAMRVLAMEHSARNTEYSYNGHRYGVLWGTDCDIIETSCLARVRAIHLSPAQLASGIYYIRRHPDMFAQHRMELGKARLECKLTLEKKRDFDLIQDIARNVPHPDQKSISAYLEERPRLASINLTSPAKEVGLEKLHLHPGKTASLMSGDDLPDLSYPISVELTLTNHCNLDCEYCSDKGLRERQGMEETLAPAALFRLFDDLKSGGTSGVVIEGGGEPTTHPEFVQIIEYLASIGLAVGLITNGTNPIPDQILSKLEWIRVSLDASTRQEFLNLKKHDYFEQVLENIHRFARFCPTVGVGYVITSQNMDRLESLIMMMRDYGVSYVQCRPVVDCPRLDLADQDLSYLHIYQTGRFAVITDGMQENAEKGNAGLPCRAHSLTNIISGDGSVYLCGRLNIYDWIKPVGNIVQNDFRTIWHGPERIAQAKMVANGSFCRKYCPQCRISKFNRLIRRMHDMSTPHFI